MDARERYDSLFEFYGAHYRVEAKLLKAQARAESNFDPDAASKAGAVGLTQFMAATFLEVMIGVNNPDRTNPEHAVEAQARYMSSLLKKYNYNIKHALAAYNCGPGRMDAYLAGEDTLPHETREYLERVMRFYKEYKSNGVKNA